MSVFRRVLTSVAFAAVFGPLCVAQTGGVPQSTEAKEQATPHEPGTGSPALTPASKAPAPVQTPDVRLDSKPHTDLDTTLDSSEPPPDLGLGANPEIDLGHDITPVTPGGMLSRSEPDNPRMVYFSLPVRSGEEISPADRAVLAARHADLLHEASRRGFHLDDAGWSSQQDICPAMQPAGSQVTTAAPAPGSGFLLLQYTKTGGDQSRSLAALVPRNPSMPVRVVPVSRGKAGKKLPLASKVDKTAANEALPPATLYPTMQPEGDWIAASACVAALQGATSSIPNEPYLSEQITTAPTPLLRLLRNGERKVVFTDRVSDARYAVWDEHVSSKGRMVSTAYEAHDIVPRPVTNPPEPTSHTIDSLPLPPTHTMPKLPSPLAGLKQ